MPSADVFEPAVSSRIFSRQGAAELVHRAPDLFDARSASYEFKTAGEPEVETGEPLLRLLEPQLFTEAPVGTHPSALLNARNARIPFDETLRERETALVQDWCEDAAPCSVRVFAGAGGSGKTRVFLELAERWRERGWQAGFVPSRPLESSELQFLVESSTPTLVVFDYAESRERLLQELTLLSRSTTGRLRIALLARTAGDWWSALRQKSEGALEPLVELDAIELAPVHIEAPQQLFERAFAHWCQLLNRNEPLPPRPWAAIRSPSILEIHAAALACALGRPLEGRSPLDVLLDVEQEEWVVEHMRTECAAAARAVAALVLRGGARTETELYEVFDIVAPLAHQDASGFRLRTLYPGDADSCVRPLEPDSLGEALVLRVLRDQQTPSDFLSRVLSGPEHPHRVDATRHTFQVLARIGLDAPEELRQWMRQALETEFDTRVPWALSAALGVATRGATSPLGQVLAQELETRGNSELALLVSEKLPEKSVSLSELGAWCYQTLANAFLPDLASSLNNLGIWRSNLGDSEGALAATEEAVGYYRELSASRPDAFLPDLAGSLHNLGIWRSELGDRGGALAATEEAVGYYRGLSGSTPEAFLPDLALSLRNLGVQRRNLGDSEGALAATEEAVGYLRELSGSRPEAFLPDLASSLNNLGIRRSDLGDRKGALAATEEAVELYLRCARAFPRALVGSLRIAVRNLERRLREAQRAPDEHLLLREAKEFLGAQGEGGE